ncbi:MAG: ethylbenzene dehydrogenase-related protein [Pseudomonadota bacterium]
MYRVWRLVVFIFLLSTILAVTTSAAQELIAVKVGEEPVIDGRADESFWSKAKAVTSHDPVANIDITIKAAHDGKKIFLLASFPDQTENRQHRTLKWDPDMTAYVNGPEREDTLIVKWSMVTYPTTLTLHENVPYQADIWFWKAMRTDPTGFADDKMHLYKNDKMKDSIMVTSNQGNVFYIARPGDGGDAAYATILYTGFKEDRVPKYDHQQPSGSRADIKARGFWHDDIWTIEFVRPLDTGHDDDVRFTVDKKYPFAVSRYEIAGRKPEQDSEQPLYGTGEVGELLFLSFGQ